MDQLQYAAYCGDCEAVNYFLAQGADVARTDDRGYSALQWAVEMACAGGERREIIDLLIKAGSNVNHRDKEGESILQTAIRCTAADDILDRLRVAGAR
jgi:ankyrin repeat protein